MPGIEFVFDLAIITVAAAFAGLLCRKAGLSPIMGYLIAGIVIGPHTPPFSPISEEGRIQILAQIGLVFLMFSIGLNLSVSRLRQLGMPLILATILTSLIVLLLSRITGAVIGLSHMESLFLAGMLMVSSSAVIAKALEETNTAHTRWGQVALNITHAEDLVAVLMLALLGSYVQLGTDGSSRGILQSLGLMAGFILLLVILGLPFVPWLLKRISRVRSQELETLTVAGLLFLLAWTAVKAGYPLALGAFIFGVIVAETSRRNQVERSFSGLKDVFSAVFFVAIGMSIDISTITDAWSVFFSISILAIVGRIIAVTIGLLLTGNEPKSAFRSALCLTPMGEFSFIIAQLGVYAAVLPTSYYAAAVGASILTSLVATISIKYSRPISNTAVNIFQHCSFLTRPYLLYRRFIREASQMQEGKILWMICRKRVIQITLEVLLVTGILAFSKPALLLITTHFPFVQRLDIGLDVLYWILLGLIVVAPLQAIWRNIDALSMILGDFAKRAWKRNAAFSRVFATIIRTLTAIILVLWFWSFLPIEDGHLWILLAVVVLMVLFTFLFWKKLVYWHSEYEVSVETALRLDNNPVDDLADRLARLEDWPVDVMECILPDQFALAGQPIANSGLRQQFGVSITLLERQGFTITSPQAATHLFPGDRLLLLGPREQLPEAVAHLLAEHNENDHGTPLDDVVLESVIVPANSPRANLSLQEWQIAPKFGIHVAGLQRNEERQVNLSGSTIIMEEDVLLVLGTPPQIKQLRQWLSSES